MPPLDNPRHERFVQALVKGKNQRKAYQAAGYDAQPRAADACASRLLTNANVKERRDHLVEQAAKRVEITRAGQIEKLERTIERAEAAAQFGPSVSAQKLQSDLAGLTTTKVEIGVINFEHMRSDEIEAALIKLLQDHGVIAAEPEMIDITPESATE